MTESQHSFNVVDFNAARLSRTRTVVEQVADSPCKVPLPFRGHLNETERVIKRRDEPVTETGRNERMREDRARAWRVAESKLKYHEAWLDLHRKIRCLHDCGALDQVDCPPSLRAMNDFEQPWKTDNPLLDECMCADRELLMTPAPTVAALQWKRKRARHVWYALADGSIEDEIAQSIAADQKWLDAHPARQCRSNSKRARKSD